jgi:hypothetical protein
MKTTLFMIIFTIMSGTTYAAENTKTVCTHGDQERLIEVIYTSEGHVPCEVHYTKATGTEIPWKAQAEIGFCAAKAADLIAKHQGWGWQCAEVVHQ